MKNKYEEVLNIFTAKEDRPYTEWMRKPFELDDKAIATDTYSMALINRNLLNNIAKIPDLNKKSVATVIEMAKARVTNVVTIEQLDIAINACPLVDEYVDSDYDSACKACNGFGNVGWSFMFKNRDYQYQHDCPVCDGEGSVVLTREISTGNKTPDKSKLITIGLATFNVDIIQKLFETAEILAESEIKVISQNNNHTATIFQIGNVEIIAMPTVGHEESIVHTIKF